MYFLITTMIMLIVLFHHTQCMLIMVICTKVNVFLEMVMLSILAWIRMVKYNLRNDGQEISKSETVIYLTEVLGIPLCYSGSECFLLLNLALNNVLKYEIYMMFPLTLCFIFWSNTTSKNLPNCATRFRCCRTLTGRAAFCRAFI
jgi:hypothetical protein